MCEYIALPVLWPGHPVRAGRCNPLPATALAAVATEAPLTSSGAIRGKCKKDFLKLRLVIFDSSSSRPLRRYGTGGTGSIMQLGDAGVKQIITHATAADKRHFTAGPILKTMRRGGRAFVVYCPRVVSFLKETAMPPANNKKKHLRGAAQIREIARRIRARDLEMICAAGTGHIGGDLSCADILATLYFHVLHCTPECPENPDRDRFVLSKGHCAGALYAVLAEAGFIGADELSTFMAPESRLNGHPSRVKTPGVETSTGPLGHGLPVAVGAAMAAKMENAAWRTFALLGDGELQEGSNWEAAMAAAHFNLDKLTVIVDRNGLQQGAPTETTNTLEPLASKWRAFGWETAETDGHDVDRMMGVFDGLPLKAGRPSCIIARTVKGRGVSFMQNKAEWHHKVPNPDERARAALELEEAKIS